MTLNYSGRQNRGRTWLWRWTLNRLRLPEFHPVTAIAATHSVSYFADRQILTALMRPVSGEPRKLGRQTRLVLLRHFLRLQTRREAQYLARCRGKPFCSCPSSQSCPAVESTTSQGSRQSRSAITWLPCLTCFGSGSEPCFAGRSEERRGGKEC